MRPEKPRRVHLRIESGVVPGRFDLTVSIRRDWRPGSALSPHWRHFTVYAAFLPVVYSGQPVHGRHWRRAWIFGRHGSGRGNFHLGPMGFVWTR